MKIMFGIVATLLVACRASSGAPDPVASSASSSSESGSEGSGSALTGESSESTSSGASARECTGLAIPGELAYTGNHAALRYSTPIVDLGLGTDAPDEFVLLFYANDAGTFVLGHTPNARHDDCAQCVFVQQDIIDGKAERLYFADAGLLTLHASPADQLHADLTNVTLLEFWFDDRADEPTCIALADREFSPERP